MKDERIKSELTEVLYEKNGQVYNFVANVLTSELVTIEGNENIVCAVVLDRTAFFPEGGGQQADTGYIVVVDTSVSEIAEENEIDKLLKRKVNKVKVLDVQADDEGKICHYLDEEIPAGSLVVGLVDENTRFRRMQNHSGEHLISGLIHSMFGYDNVGFHMLDAGARLDCSGPLSKEQIAELELAANKAIYRNVPITVSYPGKDEIKNIDYRSKLDLEDGIRLVTIEGYDICACCAPHLSSTGQIGIIKIIDAMPHRGGMRLTMVAGLDAYEDYAMLHEENGKIMALLSSKRDTVGQFSQEFFDRNQKLKEENSNLKREMVSLISETVIDKIKKRSEDDKSVEVIFTEVLDNVGLRNLINSCTEIFNGVVVGFIGNDQDGYKYIMATSGAEDIVTLNKAMTEKLSGRGGGNKQMVQGSLSATREEITSFLK